MHGLLTPFLMPQIVLTTRANKEQPAAHLAHRRGALPHIAPHAALLVDRLPPPAARRTAPRAALPTRRARRAAARAQAEARAAREELAAARSGALDDASGASAQGVRLRLQLGEAEERARELQGEVLERARALQGEVEAARAAHRQLRESWLEALCSEQCLRCA